MLLKIFLTLCTLFILISIFFGISVVLSDDDSKNIWYKIAKILLTTIIVLSAFVAIIGTAYVLQLIWS